MGNQGLDISVRELRLRHHEAIEAIAKQDAKLNVLKNELKKSNQRYNKACNTAGRYRKMLEKAADTFASFKVTLELLKHPKEAEAAAIAESATRAELKRRKPNE